MPTLIVLLHGIGQTPADMAPLADLVAAYDPHAVVAAPPAACPYDGGPAGFQWFSVDGITEENRSGRIRAALPAFVAAVEALQRTHGVGPDETVLAGFSQGAIMALAACEDRFLARHVIAIAGRCAPLPEQWDRRTRVCLVHGRHDGTVPVQYSERAFERLTLLGADVRLDVVPRAVHRLAPPLLDQAGQALHVALQGAPRRLDTTPS
jgi:phospholipase/carboxylesterase